MLQKCSQDSVIYVRENFEILNVVWRFPFTNLQMAKNASHIKARKCGIVSIKTQNCPRL